MKFTDDLLVRWRALPRWGQLLVAGAGVIVLLILLFMIPADSQVGTEAAPGGSAFSMLVSVTLKLGVVLLLIYVLAIAARQWGGGQWGGHTRQMTIVETLHLTPRRSLHIIRIAGQNLLIGATDQNVNLVTRLDDEPIANSASESAFHTILAEQVQQSGGAYPEMDRR